MRPDTLSLVVAVIFALALLHTFSTKVFERLAHARPRHAGIWHLLGEVEVVFGFWAMVLVVTILFMNGKQAAITYLESRNFTEPMFVFAIMVIAGTRPVLSFAERSVLALARLLPLSRGLAFYGVTLLLVPLLGSLITEPAAMTLAALMLRDAVFAQNVSTRLKYATLGVLFVNVSVGGILTAYAAPPVLMVATKWQWDSTFMFMHFGWKAILIVAINAIGATWWFRHELRALGQASSSTAHTPLSMSALHLGFLLVVVLTAHHPVVFMGVLLFFLGFTAAYPQHQSPLVLREALLVAFFLAGLVVLGGYQQWWLQPLLMRMDATTVFFGATALTAIVDNAALTYLASLVEGLDQAFKMALVAGAVTGGGLTIIANAPNPAGVALLKAHFADNAIHPLGLFLAALLPTLVAVVVFVVFAGI